MVRLVVINEVLLNVGHDLVKSKIVCKLPRFVQLV
jgi:hypothetical protein